MYAVLHPKSDVDRLLLSRKKGEGAGGLISAEEYVKGEVNNLNLCLKSHGNTNARSEDDWNTGTLETKNIELLNKGPLRALGKEELKRKWHEKKIHGYWY